MPLPKTVAFKADAYSRAVAPALTRRTCNAVPKAASAEPPEAIGKGVVALSVVNAPALGVVPPIAPGIGKLVTFAVPLKLDPPMVREVARAVAVPALPVTEV